METKFIIGIKNMETDIDFQRNQLEKMVEYLTDEISRDEISSTSVNSIMANISSIVAKIEVLQAKKDLMAATVEMLKEC